MIHFLPEILDGLFQMLEDNMSEIQKMCETLLSHFIKSIKHDPAAADMPSMINILIGHAQANNELVQNIAVSLQNFFMKLVNLTFLCSTLLRLVGLEILFTSLDLRCLPTLVVFSLLFFHV